MKLQYAGDRRDFYKYDLLLALGRALGPAHGITVIPMLTPDGSPREGRLREFPLKGRDPEVHAFVQSLQDDPHPLDRVAEFFGRCGVELRFAPEGTLLPDARARYFAGVDDRDLRDAIVFLDPDIGLEVKSASRRNTKYLHYGELDGIYGRMSGTSVLVCYQHMPRRPHAEVYRELPHVIFEHTSVRSMSLVDMGDIGFIVSARAERMRMEIAKALGGYAQRTSVQLAGAAMSAMVGVRRGAPSGDGG